MLPITIRRPRRSVTGIQVLGIVICALALIFLGYAVACWITMLIIGMLHADWLHSMPTLSYHSAIVLGWIIGVPIGGVGVAAARR